MLKIEAMGDQAALIRFDNEQEPLQMASLLRENPPPWMIDVVQAYATIAVFFDLRTIRYVEVAEHLQSCGLEAANVKVGGKLHTIPCCYEKEQDLQRVVEHTGLTAEEVIALHTGTTYTIYAIGFCPGFPYLGYLPDALAPVPRLETPRVRVEPGSVAITGRQTGVYTLARPGGWNVIGHAPLELVHIEDGYFPLRTGDRVRFKRIDEREHQHLLGERL